MVSSLRKSERRGFAGATKGGLFGAGADAYASPWIGLPHFGQAAALLLTSAPHSSHVINAIAFPRIRFD
jgi:hypothetical protein